MGEESTIFLHGCEIKSGRGGLGFEATAVVFVWYGIYNVYEE